MSMSIDLWPLIQPWIVSKTGVAIYTLIAAALSHFFVLPEVPPTKKIDPPVKMQMEDAKP